MTDTPGWGSPQGRREGDQEGGQEGGTAPDANVPPGWSSQQPPPAPPPGQGGWTQPGPGRQQGGGQQQGWGQQPTGQGGWGQQQQQQGWAPQQGWGQPGWGQARPEVKPGIVPLRPLGVGEILDGAISCMRAHPRPMIGLSAIVVTVTQVLQLLLTWWLVQDVTTASASLESGADFSDVASVMGDSFVVFLVGIILGGVAQLVLTGLLTVVVSRAVVGQPATVEDAWSVVRPQMLRLIGLTLLVGLLYIVGFVLCVLPFFYLWALFGLATPALILERQGVTAALRRSAKLVTGNWWRVFGILALTTLISFFIAAIIGTPFSLIGSGGQMFSVDGDPAETYTFFALTMSAIGGIIAGTITYPFAAGVRVLLYVDQRIRREALDLELARAAGVNLPGRPEQQQGQQGEPPTQPQQPPGTPPPGW
jgi:hypothetical protein